MYRSMLTAALVCFVTPALAISPDLLSAYGTLCGVLPPISARQKPAAPYLVQHLDSFGIQVLCGGGRAKHTITACAIPPPSTNSPDHWIIAITDGLSKKDEACVLIYEKAHMPPNNWIDPAWEAYMHQNR